MTNVTMAYPRRPELLRHPDARGAGDGFLSKSLRFLRTPVLDLIVGMEVPGQDAPRPFEDTRPMMAALQDDTVVTLDREWMVGMEVRDIDLDEASWAHYFDGASAT